MDEIYSNATITFVNSAGQNAEDGIPGVSKRHSCSLRTAKAFGVHFTIVPNLRRLVKDSKWASRGQTYQEGLLSRRRLVFTEAQAYFQCLGMQTWESIGASLETVRNNTPFVGRLDYAMQSFPDLIFTSTCLEEWHDEFFQKESTYDLDVLNAFSGVLRQAWYREVYYFWGMIFRRPDHTPHNLEAQFLFSLLWKTRERTSAHSVTRRENFPSWSMFGWKGISSHDYNFYRTTAEGDPLEISVKFVDLSDELVSVASYVRSMTNCWDLNRFKPHIIVTGWTGVITFTCSNVNAFQNVSIYGETGGFVGRGMTGMHEDCIIPSYSKAHLALFITAPQYSGCGILLEEVEHERDVFWRVGNSSSRYSLEVPPHENNPLQITVHKGCEAILTCKRRTITLR